MSTPINPEAYARGRNVISLDKLKRMGKVIPTKATVMPVRRPIMNGIRIASHTRENPRF